MTEVKVTQEIKVVVLGNPEVGKSTIVSRFCQGRFHEDYLPTVGSEYDTNILQVDGAFVKIHVTDISGENRFLRLNTGCLSDADGFMLVYDVTDAESFEALKNWLRVVEHYAKSTNLPKVLIGNKSDLRHLQKVEPSRAKEWGVPEGMSHVEVSAKMDKYLNVAFYAITSDILRHRRLGTVKVIGDHRMPLLVLPPNAEEQLPVKCLRSVNENPSDYAHLFKIMLVGAPRVGKSAIRYRYCSDHFSPEYFETCGFDHSATTVTVEGTRIRVQLWDISGDSLWKDSRRNLYKGANGFLIAYDVTNGPSFTRAEELLKELDMCGAETAPKVLVGNKIDLASRKRVDFTYAQEFADGWRLPVVETSASSGLNVQFAITKVLVALKRQNAPWKRIYNFS